jgi:hypothetical protein
MTKYFLTIGLALLWGVSFAGQAQAGDPGCCGNASCEAGCGNAGCDSCCNCCPHCGCKLVPQCHVYWETKKVTKYVYTCKCDAICVPKVECCCHKGCGEGCGCKEGCQEGCCENGCDNGCGCCKCCVHEVKKLVKCPCVHEECVRKCSVTWCCPNCGCGGCCEGNCCGSESTSAPAAAPAKAPVAPAPVPKMPAPPKTTNYAPRLSEIGS